MRQESQLKYAVFWICISGHINAASLGFTDHKKSANLSGEAADLVFS